MRWEEERGSEANLGAITTKQKARRREREKDKKRSWFDVNWNKINPLDSKKWCGVKNATHKMRVFIIKMDRKRPNDPRAMDGPMF